MTQPTPTPTRTTIILPARTVGQLHLRDSHENRSATILTQLDRYFYLLDRACAKLAETFTTSELALIADATNGIRWADSVGLNHLWVELHHAVHTDQLAEKWGVDGTALIRKVKELDLLSTFALVDAVERWWNRQVGPGEDRPGIEEILPSRTRNGGAEGEKENGKRK